MMRKTLRFKTLCLLLSLLWILATPTSTHAWGPEGHRIVARIAALRLKAKTVTFITRLLGSDPSDPENCAKKTLLEDRLACISVWADTVRSDPRFQYTRNEHFVSIPINVPAPQQRYDPARDCRNEDCIVVAIEKYSKTLTDGTRSSADRALAMKFLVHLIADLHQPLHVATDQNLDTLDPARSVSDFGGNLKVVSWMGKSSDQFGCLNLHQVWDTNFLTHAMREQAPRLFNNTDERTYTKLLMASPSAKEVSPLQEVTVLKWVEESYRLAIANAYGLLPQPTFEEFCERGATCGPCSTRPQNEIRHRLRYYLNETYYTKNKRVIETQLVRAGLRLAQILNSAADGKLK